MRWVGSVLPNSAFHTVELPLSGRASADAMMDATYIEFSMVDRSAEAPSAKVGNLGKGDWSCDAGGRDAELIKGNEAHESTW